MGWFTPQGALDAYQREEILLVFPTIKTLEQLAAVRHRRGAARLRSAAATVEPILPKVVASGDSAKVFAPPSPGEPGYPDD